MIRGINKRVIEINDIGSEYFEKAFLIVKDNKATVPHLEREADRVMRVYFPSVSGYRPVSGYLRKMHSSRKKIALCAGLGALLLVILAAAVVLSL